jgi:hypothetical protein
MHTHSQRLERWLGAENVDSVSRAMRDWYGPPIALHGAPGQVWAAKGGDFVGAIDAGYEASALDRFADIHKREVTRRRARLARAWKQHGAITSLDECIAAVAAGGRRDFNFNKAGSTGVAGVTNSLWGVGSMPAAGANAANAPGGESPTDATTGAFTFDNPSSGTQHVLMGYPVASVAANTLLLYDRLFQVNKTMNSTATEAVTGTQSRYASTTAGAADSAEGNFLFIEVGGTALAATAHNWTVCTYTDQSGNTGATLPSVTGNSGAIVRRLDHPTSQWFAPLASGDTGIRYLTQMQCSAAVATGVINFVIGHPLAWMPCPIANHVCVYDGVTSSFSLVRVMDDAALAFLEICKPATTATTYTGQFSTIRG